MRCLITQVQCSILCETLKMKCIIFAAFLLCIFVPGTYSRNIQFYRKDYTYIEDFDAFYKVHWDATVANWNNAFFACNDEEATLFYPKTNGEWTLVKNLTDQMSEVPNVTDIFVGLHDEFKLGEFITVDGLSTPYPLPAEGSLLPHSDKCITMNIETGRFQVDSCLATTPLPFLCKKVDEESCPTIDHGYKYLKTPRKCYKVNNKPQKWKEAMKTCFMEGATLAVIENSVQAEEINKYLEREKIYFVGVRKLMPRDDYYTIKGQKFSDMYQRPYENDPPPSRNPYSNNGPNENGYFPNPNGFYPDENGYYPNEYGEYPDGRIAERVTLRIRSDDCGNVKNSGNLYTGHSDCDEPLPFICEMEV